MNPYAIDEESLAEIWGGCQGCLWPLDKKGELGYNKVASDNPSDFRLQTSGFRWIKFRIQEIGRK